MAAACAVAASVIYPANARASACDAPVYHSYDFFVGDWQVYRKDGKFIARDRVTKDLDGCAILERWGKDEGAGYSAYDAQQKHWVQTFFQNDGSVLMLAGAPVSEGMLFTGVDHPKPNVTRRHRILFRKRADGFEEYWTVSMDGGHSWKKVFDGFFRRNLTNS